MGKAPYVSKHRLDRTSISVIKRTYMPGTKVEAVKVQNVPDGMRGIIRNADDSGIISVIWNDGSISNVLFGYDSVKVITGGKCMLGRSMFQGGCDGTFCSKCGWNEVIHEERLKRIRNGGLMKSEGGNRYLKIEGSNVRPLIDEK